MTIARGFKIVMTAVLISSIFGYSYIEAKGIMQGPKIVIEEPYNGATTDKQLLTVRGRAYNSVDITLNNRKIYIDKNGTFTEDLLLFEGNNVISIKAQDRFQKWVEKNIQVVYNAPTEPILTQTAQSIQDSKPFNE